jgi:hypothetical protein
METKNVEKCSVLSIINDETVKQSNTKLTSRDMSSAYMRMQAHTNAIQFGKTINVRKDWENLICYKWTHKTIERKIMADETQTSIMQNKKDGTRTSKCKRGTSFNLENNTRKNKENSTKYLFDLRKWQRKVLQTD